MIVYDELGFPRHFECGGFLYQSVVDRSIVCLGCGCTVGYAVKKEDMEVEVERN